jgi:hypothetical protein
VGAIALDPLYPDLRLDFPRWGSNTKGIRNYECLAPDPTQPGATPWYERQPGMTLLYTAKTMSPGSALAGMPVAWRTNATAEEVQAGSDRGRIICFSFNPFYFEVAPMKGAMTLALNWLVEGEDL